MFAPTAEENESKLLQLDTFLMISTDRLKMSLDNDFGLLFYKTANKFVTFAEIRRINFHYSYTLFNYLLNLFGTNQCMYHLK